MEVLNQFRQYIQDVDNLKVLKPSVTIATQLISFVNHILQNKHYYQNNNITLTEYEEQILLAVVNYITGSDESNCNKLTVPIKLDMI
jgi:helix-turn-helix protein